MQRGDLYWAELLPRSGSEQRGRRPVIVISNDGFNEVPTWRSVIVIPISTSSSQARRGPTVVPISAPAAGLSPDSAAVCHQITTLDRAKLTARIGSLPDDDLEAVERGVIAACDLPL